MSDFQIVDPSPGSTAGSTAGNHPPSAVAEPALLPLPRPGVAFDVRPGTMDDLPWVDAMQKADREGLGFRFQAELEGHVRQGNLWIAESPAPGTPAPGTPAPGTPAPGCEANDDVALTGSGLPGVGYCIARDRYQKRDELGLVIQLCVAPAYRRSLVAANLLSRVWEAWPAGVKLCCCWCAQDLPANRYWEACGFRALAFRTGSRETSFTRWNEDGTSGGKVKGHRIHIFWQKRINQGDGGLGDIPSGGGGDTSGCGSGGTAYWFPSETGGGSINESRLVFPIPPGSSWRDAKPSILPGVGDLFEALRREREAFERRALLQLAPPDESGGPELSRKERAAMHKQAKAERAAAQAERQAQRAALVERRQTAAGHGGLQLGWNALPGAEELDPDVLLSEEAIAEREKQAKADTKREKAEAVKQAKREAKQAARKMSSKNDPALAALARELRDRWIAAVETDAGMLSLASSETSGGRYDVSRQLTEHPGASLSRSPKRVENMKRLAA